MSAGEYNYRPGHIHDVNVVNVSRKMFTAYNLRPHLGTNVLGAFDAKGTSSSP